MSTSIDRTVPAPWRWFFLVAAIYDIALGLAFMLAGESVLEAIGMELPPHAEAAPSVSERCLEQYISISSRINASSRCCSSKEFCRVFPCVWLSDELLSF